jgi:hypothetical protein
MRPQRIFYVLHDNPRPLGGEKHSYQHVDLLNEAGYEAYALHRTKGFRLTWFENQTRVIDLESVWDIYDKERDFLVVPETLGGLTLSLPGKRVIFNKNLYYGYDVLGLEPVARLPYSHPKVEAIFSVSEHNLSHLRFAFPRAPLFRMFAHIDTDRFTFRPLAEKKRRIACIMKEKEELAVLYHTLCARAGAGLNQLANYEWTFLQGLSEREAAQVLSESLLLVGMSTHEGLPRTVLEGMAAGCLLVVPRTGPTKECVPAEYQFEPDDFITMARRIEAVTNAFPGDLAAWAPVVERGRALAQSFTRERQKQHLLSAWEQILKGLPRPAQL